MTISMSNLISCNYIEIMKKVIEDVVMKKKNIEYYIPIVFKITVTQSLLNIDMHSIFRFSF